MTKRMMFAMLAGAGILGSLAVPTTAAAQVVQDGSTVPGTEAVVPMVLKNGRTGKVQAFVQVDRNGYAIDGRESFQLVAANVPAAAATVYGGDYVLSQGCASYGTLALQVLGPDGTTWQTLVSKTSGDSGAAVGLVLGSYAKVRVTVTGTAGCNALLARVPA